MPSRARTSVSMSLKARPSAARKHTEPVPVAVRSVAASSVIAADGSANRASRFGGTGFVRPSSASRNPTWLAGRAELLGDLVQLGQPLLQARVRREQVVDATLARQRRGEVEGVQRLGLAQVPGRDP